MVAMIDNFEEKETEYTPMDTEADEHYIRCVVCDELVDVTEVHPVVTVEKVDELGEAVTQVYHFCSGECRVQWKREHGSGM